MGETGTASLIPETMGDRFRVYFDHSPYGVLVADGAGQLYEANAAACRLTGYSESELQAMTVPELHPPEIREDIRVDFEELRTRGFIRRRRAFLNKDGSTGWCLVNAVKVSEDRYLGYISDVTKLKETEEALSASEEQLRLFIEHVPAGVVMLDREMRYLACSQRWLRDFGLDGQNVIGRCHYEVFPEMSEDWRELHRRCLRGASECREEDEFRREDGSVQYVRCEIQPWYDSSEAVGGLVMFTEDISERVLAERALRKSEEQLAEAQHVAHLGNWVWDIVADTITWSDEVYRIFGREPQSFVPIYESDFLQAVHPDDREKVTTAVGDALRLKQPYSVDHRVIRPDGTERVVHEQGTVEYDGADRPVRMFGVVQDVTDRTSAEAQLADLRDQLAHASRLGTMGELASGLAHELNQPLTAIHLQSHTAALLAKKLDGEVAAKLQASLELIGEQALRAGEIVQRMRSFIRQRTPLGETCDLTDLLKVVLKLMENELRIHAVSLDIDVPRDLPVVCVDQIQIQQVLVNLVQNAIDAMSDQDKALRKLSISISERDEMVAVRVADSGVGLTPEAADKVFDAFHTTKKTGLGLGLAICRTLIEAHRGTISACPGANGGAVFEFRLPSGPCP